MSINLAKHRPWGVPAKLLCGMVFTLLLIGLLELGLWLVPGLETIRPVERFPTGGQTHVAINPEFTRFVLQRDNVDVDHRTWLPQQTPPGTLRVAFLGESAAAGYPSPDFNLARLVTALWNDRHPERPMESANFTSVGINSHILRIFAREAAALRPNAVVVYAGNNEAIGPYGPASVWGQQLPSTLLAQASLAVRNTRIGMAITKAFEWLPADAKEPKSWRSLDEFKNVKIPADSPAVARMTAQTHDNFEAIVRTSREAGAKVLLCQPAVNLADWPPLASEKPEEKSAEKFYAQAREAETKGKKDEAIALYRRACDLDLMRLRADTNARKAIESAATTANDPGVALLDTDRRLHEENPGPLGDRQFFLEHVHLTFEARVALAEMIIEELEQMLLGAKPEKPTPQEWWARFQVKLARAKEVLLFTDFDRIDMTTSIERLLEMDIFQSSAGLEQRRATLSKRAEHLLEKTRAEWNLERARTAYARAKASSGCDDLVHSAAGKIFETVGAKQDALAAYREALRMRPNNTHARFALVREALASGALDTAEKMLTVDYLDPKARGLAKLKGELLAKQGQFKPAAEWLQKAVTEAPSDGDLLRNLASVQQQAGMTAKAIKNYRTIAEAAPNDAYVFNNLAWLLVTERRPDQREKAEALVASRKAINLEPGRAEYWGTYATVLAANAMNAEATNAAKKATQLAHVQKKPETAEAMRRILDSSGAD
jgi:tetratricopeptide (TPR) repeat protein